MNQLTDICDKMNELAGWWLPIIMNSLPYVSKYMDFFSNLKSRNIVDIVLNFRVDLNANLENALMTDFLLFFNFSVAFPL